MADRATGGPMAEPGGALTVEVLGAVWGSLIRLGDSHQAADQRDVARAAWRQALSILDELGHAEADSIRARLDAPATYPPRSPRAG